MTTKRKALYITIIICMGSAISATLAGNPAIENRITHVFLAFVLLALDDLRIKSRDIDVEVEDTKNE